MRFSQIPREASFCDTWLAIAPFGWASITAAQFHRCGMDLSLGICSSDSEVCLSASTFKRFGMDRFFRIRSIVNARTIAKCRENTFDAKDQYWFGFDREMDTGHTGKAWCATTIRVLQDIHAWTKSSNGLESRK
jgi:hypothetical protein